MIEEGEGKRSPVLTVDECAVYLRIARGLAYSMIHEGRIPSIRLGKRILVPRAALERMLEVAMADHHSHERSDP